MLDDGSVRGQCFKRYIICGSSVWLFLSSIEIYLFGSTSIIYTSQLICTHLGNLLYCFVSFTICELGSANLLIRKKMEKKNFLSRQPNKPWFVYMFCLWSAISFSPIYSILYNLFNLCFIASIITEIFSCYCGTQWCDLCYWWIRWERVFKVRCQSSYTINYGHT